MKFVVLAAIVVVAIGASSAEARVAPSSKGLPHAVSTAERAWAWFWTPAVQCETSHEGAWGTDTGTYRGKFQMDYGFQTSTPYGRKMTARFGLASHWPRIVQVVHAYSVWLHREWNPWPPYAKFCSGKWPSGSWAWVKHRHRSASPIRWERIL